MPLYNPMSLETVEAELSAASYSLTTNTYETVGCTLTSLRPGRWHITGKVRSIVQCSVGAGYITHRLYNTTAAAAIAGSESIGPIAIATGVPYPENAPIDKVITLTATSTIDLQSVTPAGYTYTVRDLYTDADGRTTLTATYLGPV